MAIYYIENENGSFKSADGTRCFMRLSGRKAYEYLKSPEGQKKRFMRTSSHEDGGEEEYVEIPSSHLRHHRKDERHEQYASDCMESSGFITISLFAMEDDKDNDLSSGEVLIADPNQNTEEQALHAVELETLHKAIGMLTKEEQQLIYDLYFAEHPLTVREMGRKYGVHYVTISKRRKAVLEKLRELLEK